MKRFQRTIESFVCEHCGAKVEGNGYTNHCPHCLYSQHVDVHPGDRAHSCQGMMEPMQIIVKAGDPQSVVHRCLRCRTEQKTKLSDQDSMSTIIEVMKTFAEKQSHMS